MTPLIEIQLITSTVIIAVLAVGLRLELFRKAFRGLNAEEGFPAFRWIIMAIMLYLTFLISRDVLTVTWRALR
jgi:hypothetical protein